MARSALSGAETPTMPTWSPPTVAMVDCVPPGRFAATEGAALVSTSFFSVSSPPAHSFRAGANAASFSVFSDEAMVSAFAISWLRWSWPSSMSMKKVGPAARSAYGATFFSFVTREPSLSMPPSWSFTQPHGSSAPARSVTR